MNQLSLIASFMAGLLLGGVGVLYVIASQLGKALTEFLPVLKQMAEDLEAIADEVEDLAD